MKDSKNDILEFWFVETQPAQWFLKNDDFDAQCSERFLSDYELGAAGIFDSWMDSAEGSLALCILLDQLPRNMFRNSPAAFATDAKALKVAVHAVAKRFDMLMPAMKRRFLYLPFEHSESLLDQNKSVALFETMQNDDPMAYQYALRHRAVIDQYGRFPHRNAVLGRVSTPSEEEYLSQPGAGF